MNKRARLARRILRDHRGDRRFGHSYRANVLRDDTEKVIAEVFGAWLCPHCVKWWE